MIDPREEPEPASGTPGTSAFIVSKVMSVLALAWLVYMTVIAWQLYAEGHIDAVIPTWNAMFTAGTVLIVIQLFRHREWARRWIQGAALCTAIMNLLVAIKPGGETYWAGVAILGMCAWSLSIARPEYLARDSGQPPGTIAKAMLWAALIGTIIIALVTSR